MAIDDFKETSRCLRIFGSSIKEGFHRTFDQGERGSQFVTYICNKFATSAFELPKSSGIVEDHYRTTAATVGCNNSYGVDLDRARFGREREFKKATSNPPFTGDFCRHISDGMGAKCFE